MWGGLGHLRGAIFFVSISASPYALAYLIDCSRRHMIGRLEREAGRVCGMGWDGMGGLGLGTLT